MALTLNQIIQRLETLALSHNQINHFFIGEIDQFLAEEVTYPAIFCESKAVSISRSKRQTSFGFKMYFLDLVNVVEKTQLNEWEVKSDMVSVAEDYLAMLFSTDYQDTWDISFDNNGELYDFALQDLCSGVGIDITISKRYAADRCQVPAESVTFETPNNDLMTQIYTYTGSGSEGVTLTVGSLANKKILLAIKGDKTLEVITTGSPTNQQVKYTIGTGNFTFGNDIENSQFIQILWRNLG